MNTFNLARGNMWDHADEADIVLVTANSYLTKQGKLVMGRGAAQHARDNFEDIDLDYGRAILRVCGHLGTYCVLLNPLNQDGDYVVPGIFQVKYGFKDRANKTLIAASVAVLRTRAVYEWSGLSIFINYPGIGNGGLAEKDVAPLLDLPPNVTVWKYD